MTQPKPTALLFIANGSEEMEATITADVLRRAGVRFFIGSIFFILITFKLTSFVCYQSLN